MTTHKRFQIETGQTEKGDTPMIYDWEGLDDYYFMNDCRDFKGLCKLLNELHEENQELKKQNKELHDKILRCQGKLKREETENKDYRIILQELGLLHSEGEVLKIREALSEKLFKPLFENEGIDVDIDITNGFEITPKNEEE